MNNRTLIMALTAVALATACDPYDKTPGGAPQIVNVYTTQSGQLGGNALAQTGTNASGTWNLGIPTVCDAGAISVSNPLIFVAFNKLISGASIQTAPDNCTPAANWLTVTGPALPAGQSWYSCFSPQSTVPGEVSYVVIFPAAAGGASGWDEPEALVGAATNTPITFAGSVTDKRGTAIPVNINGAILFPGITFDDAAFATTATTATIGWTAPGCGATADGYRIERAPNLVYSPGEYTVIVPSQTATTFTDTGLTENAIYWYRVTPLQGTAAGTPTETQVQVTAPPPAP